MCWQLTGQASIITGVLGRQVQIGWTDTLMMGGRMVHDKIISTVIAAWLPEDVKLALADMIPDPIKVHVDGLGSFLLYSVIGNTIGHTIIHLEQCGRLQMAKFI